MARVVIAPEVARVMTRKMRARVDRMGNQEFRCLVCGAADRVSDDGIVHVVVYMDDASAYVRFAHEACAPSMVITVPGLSQTATEPDRAAFFVRAYATPRPLLLFPLPPPSPPHEAGFAGAPDVGEVAGSAGGGGTEQFQASRRTLITAGFQRLAVPVHLCAPSLIQTWSLELSQSHLLVRTTDAPAPVYTRELANVEPGFLAALHADGSCVLVTGEVDLDQIKTWPDDLQPWLDKALEAEHLVGATVQFQA
jgi:hypothetical protein